EAAEGIHVAENDVRPARAHARVVDAETLGDAAAEVLQHHVRALHELPEDLQPFRLLEIDEDAALAAVDVVVAQHGFSVRAVDADHVGAELGEGPPACGTSQHDAEIHDSYALQRRAEHLA